MEYPSELEEVRLLISSSLGVLSNVAPGWRCRRKFVFILPIIRIPYLCTLKIHFSWFGIDFSHVSHWVLSQDSNRTVTDGTAHAAHARCELKFADCIIKGVADENSGHSGNSQQSAQHTKQSPQQDLPFSEFPCNRLPYIRWGFACTFASYGSGARWWCVHIFIANRMLWSRVN